MLKKFLFGSAIGPAREASESPGRELLQVVYEARTSNEWGPALAPGMFQACSSKKADSDMTGILLYFGNRFAGFIEGPPSQVSDAISAMQHDPRGEQFRVVVSSTSQERNLPSWVFGFQDGSLPGNVWDLGNYHFQCSGHALDDVLAQASASMSTISGMLDTGNHEAHSWTLVTRELPVSPKAAAAPSRLAALMGRRQSHRIH